MKTYQACLVALLFVASLSSCQSHSAKPGVSDVSAPSSEESEANLTRNENDHRKSLITDVAYDFDAHLDAASDTFKVTSTVTFTLAKQDSVFLDLANGAQIGSLVIMTTRYRRLTHFTA